MGGARKIKTVIDGGGKEYLLVVDDVFNGLCHRKVGASLGSSILKMDKFYELLEKDAHREISDQPHCGFAEKNLSMNVETRVVGSEARLSGSCCGVDRRLNNLSFQGEGFQRQVSATHNSLVSLDEHVRRTSTSDGQAIVV
ncbi:unnamed protein product [Camellia sinensis]